MPNTNNWLLDNQNDDFVDFEKEIVSFPDEGNTSIDTRLTFDINAHSAYLVMVRHNDDGNTFEFDGQVNITWEEGLRLIGDLACLLDKYTPIKAIVSTMPFAGNEKSTVSDVLLHTNWPLLSEQKMRLLSFPMMMSEDQLALDGIIHFLDAIQDAVVFENIAPESSVFSVGANN